MNYLRRSEWIGRLGTQLSSPQTVNCKILRAAATTITLTAAAKLPVVLKESLVARRFGRASAMDAFFIAWMLPTFVISLIGGSFGAAFVPSFIQARDQESDLPAVKLLGSVLLASWIALVALAAAMCLLAPKYLPLLMGSFPPSVASETLHLLYVLTPYLIFGSGAGILAAVLNAEEIFALPAISGALLPLGIIVGLLIWSGRWGVYSLGLGAGAGALTQCLLLGGALSRRFPELRLRWHRGTGYLRQVGKQYVPMLAGSAVMGCTTLVDQAMAAYLPGGSVSALNYGNRVVALGVALLAVAVSNSILPYFSQQTAAHDWQGCRRTAALYFKGALAVTIPIAVLLIILSHPIVDLLYQRGAFSSADTLVVSRVQQALAVQLPFYVAGMVYVRLLSALRANRCLLWTACINLPTDLVLDYIGMRFGGVVGIAAATSVMYAVAMATVYLLTERELKIMARRFPAAAKAKE